MKRQPTEWEKIFVNKATDKGLTSKIYKQVMKLNTKKKKKLILKKDTMGEEEGGCKSIMYIYSTICKI